MTTDSEAAS